MVQMLPGDILENGVDGDGDGRVALKTSPADALMSGANLLRDLGWRAGEPWLQEVVVPPNLDWSQTGLRSTLRGAEWRRLGVRARHGQIAESLPANIILPEGHKGPAFIAYPNFHVFFEWNQSFTYVLTAAYFATRLEGAAVFGAPKPRSRPHQRADEGASAQAASARLRRGRRRRHSRCRNPRSSAGHPAEARPACRRLADAVTPEQALRPGGANLERLASQAGHTCLIRPPTPPRARGRRSRVGSRPARPSSRQTGDPSGSSSRRGGL